MFVLSLVLISCTITSTFTVHYLLALCMVAIGNSLSLVWLLVLRGDYPRGPLFVLWSCCYVSRIGGRFCVGVGFLV